MKKRGLTFVSGIIALVAIFIVVSLFLVKVLWAWTIPDLFPGAVKQGLIAHQISWRTALKISIFFAFLGGMGKANVS